MVLEELRSSTSVHYLLTELSRIALAAAKLLALHKWRRSKQRLIPTQPAPEALNGGFREYATDDPVTVSGSGTREAVG